MGRMNRKSVQRGQRRRQRRHRRWIGVIAPWTGGALALAGALAAASWLGQSDWASRQLDAAVSQALRASIAAGLSIEKVTVIGRKETAPAAVLAALGAKRGDPILAQDLEAIKARLEALPWVEAAAVERRLPSEIRLVIEEREPIALWRTPDGDRLVDRGGGVIDEPRIERFRHLVALAGEDAPREAAALIDLLGREAQLKDRVVAAARVAGRRWNLRFDNGVELRLPEIGPERAWAEFARLEASHRLLERDVTVIDLRFADRLVVRLTPAAAAARRAPQDDT
jgi:cell division protein FtsQ